MVHGEMCHVSLSTCDLPLPDTARSRQPQGSLGVRVEEVEDGALVVDLVVGVLVWQYGSGSSW